MRQSLSVNDAIRDFHQARRQATLQEIIARFAGTSTRLLPFNDISQKLNAVPDQSHRFKRALLAYDGSPKAREALFVATYLAGRWSMPLVVCCPTA